MRAEIVLVTGVAGTGKTTICSLLRTWGVPAISIDEEPNLSYWSDKEGGKRVTPVMTNETYSPEFMANHYWYCDIPYLQKLIEESPKPVAVCGGCANIIKCAQLCDRLLLLQCSQETFIGRIKKRTNNLYGQTEASLETLLGYYETYERNCIKNGAIIIDAEQSVEQVAFDVLNQIY